MEREEETFNFCAEQEFTWERDISGRVIRDENGKPKIKRERIFYIKSNKSERSRFPGQKLYLEDQYVCKIATDTETGKFIKIEYGTYPDGKANWNIKNVNKLSKSITKRLANENEGRDNDEFYPSIILNILDSNSENIEYLRFPLEYEEIDKNIWNIINVDFLERHHETHNNNSDQDNITSRFLLIPYSVEIKTQLRSLGFTAHQTFLIIDLDHKNKNVFEPKIFCYDSFHATCKFHGFFGFKVQYKTMIHLF